MAGKSGEDRLFLVGIGGAGLSGLARYLQMKGKVVSGSDKRASRTTRSLQEAGIPVFIGHEEENLNEGITLVIHSSAVGEEIPELACARRRGIPTMLFSKALSQVAQEKDILAVAGTHGKSTTAALVAHILFQAGEDPSFIIGGETVSPGGNARYGEGDFFIAEACEYKRSFHALRPTIGAITNIEADHLDYYQDLNDIFGAFRFFLQSIPEQGQIILDASIEKDLLDGCAVAAQVETFGYDAGADWRAVNIQKEGIRRSFQLQRRGEIIGQASLRIPGDFNIPNALAAAAAACHAGADPDDILHGIETFPGVHRRFEIKMDDPIFLVDDYAHHPTEISMVVRTLREAFPSRRLLCMFQPHQHSRTRIFMNELAASFNGADEVMISPIYRARDCEEEWNAVRASDLVQAMGKKDICAEFFPDFESCLSHIHDRFESDSVLVTLGAGDISWVADELVRRYSTAT